MLDTMKTQKQPASTGFEQTCEHGWATASTHPTSLGTVVYRECVRCGAYRVELHEPGSLMPSAPLSRATPQAAETPSAIPCALADSGTPG